MLNNLLVSFPLGIHLSIVNMCWNCVLSEYFFVFSYVVERLLKNGEDITLDWLAWIPERTYPQVFELGCCSIQEHYNMCVAPMHGMLCKRKGLCESSIVLKKIAQSPFLGSGVQTLWFCKWGLKFQCMFPGYGWWILNWFCLFQFFSWIISGS